MVEFVFHFPRHRPLRPRPSSSVVMLYDGMTMVIGKGGWWSGKSGVPVELRLVRRCSLIERASEQCGCVGGTPVGDIAGFLSLSRSGVQARIFFRLAEHLVPQQQCENQRALDHCEQKLSKPFGRCRINASQSKRVFLAHNHIHPLRLLTHPATPLVTE